jgi:hypothetical protein
MSGEILTERRGRVLVITINRPEASNSSSRWLPPTTPTEGAIALAEKCTPNWTGT